MLKLSNYETFKVKEVPYVRLSNTNEFLIRNIDNHIVNVRLHLSQFQLLSSGVFEGDILKKLYKAELETLIRCVYEWFKYFPQLEHLREYRFLESDANDLLLYRLVDQLTAGQVQDKVARYCSFLNQHYLPMLLQMSPMLKGFPAYVG